MLLSFVIPCYHSAATLPGVVREIRQTVETDGRYDYEVILVNDNPPDATWEAIRALCAEDARVRGVSMARNFGQQAALMAGYRLARGEIIISLDDDGQTPPRQAFRLIDALNEETDIAYAHYGHKQHALWRNLGSYLYDRMDCWLLDKPKGLYMASYYAAKRFVIDEMIRYEGPCPYIEGLALRSTRRVASVPVEHVPRAEGQSGYTLSKLIGVWFNSLTSFSVKPLRLAAAAGLAIAAAGFVMALVIVIQKLVRQDIDAGWTSLICVMLILGGLILTVLGVLGEYIGRLCQIVSGTPQYSILERCGTPPEAQP